MLRGEQLIGSSLETPPGERFAERFRILPDLLDIEHLVITP